VKPQVAENLNRHLKLCCDLYNGVKQQDEDSYRKTEKSPSKYDVICMLPEVKKVSPEYKEVNAQVLQDVVERYFRNKQGFFVRLKKKLVAGMPRYKSCKRYDSLTYKQNGYKLVGNTLTLANIGTFKLRLQRPIEGTIKTITVSRKYNGIFVNFTTESKPKKLRFNRKEIGLDLNVSDNYIMTSEGEAFSFHNPLKTNLEELKAKCKRHSKSRGSSQLKRIYSLKKLHAKVKNSRLDFQHKLTRKLVNTYGTIAIEDLKPSEMLTENSSINRSLSDQAFAQFIEILSYKAEEAGRKLIKVNPAYTSKTCSNCGAIHKNLEVGNKEFNCNSCNFHANRDFNAAKNILARSKNQGGRLCGYPVPRNPILK
jgi:putative transposase